MRSRKKTLLTALIVGLIAAVCAYHGTPHLSSSCQELREKTEQLALSDSGLAGVIIAVPQEQMDKAFFIRDGSLTDAQCAERAAPLSAVQEAMIHTPWAPKMARAGEQAKEAIRECHDKRTSGELKTHADSALCSNPKITAAFTSIGYPYTELLEKLAQRRLELARQVDKSLLADSEDSQDFASLALEIAEAEAALVTAKK